MMNFLEKASVERKELNIIENRIEEACSKVDLTKGQVREDLAKFNYVNKINLKCVDAKNKPCSVVQRSRAYLYGEKFPSADEFTSVCDHTVSQDDRMMRYIKSYEIYQIYC